jgi:hypothetical protein
VYRRSKDDAVAQALTALLAKPTTVEVIRLVLFGEQPATLRNASIRPSMTAGDTHG